MDRHPDTEEVTGSNPVRPTSTNVVFLDSFLAAVRHRCASVLRYAPDPWFEHSVVSAGDSRPLAHAHPGAEMLTVATPADAEAPSLLSRRVAAELMCSAQVSAYGRSQGTRCLPAEHTE